MANLLGVFAGRTHNHALAVWLKLMIPASGPRFRPFLPHRKS